MASRDVSLQRSLFDAPAVSFDSGFRSLERIWLDGTAWVDFQRGWVAGPDALFEQILIARDWAQRTRTIHDQSMIEPRLTAPWSLRAGAPLEPAVLEEIRRALSARYAVVFDSVGFNLYRDGQDSVAWHRDLISHDVVDPVVALVSVGERRTFLLRPRGGGKSVRFQLGAGDLLVTGGSTQRAWEHTVPKVARAGPRISLAYRHGAVSTNDE
jgi:alkylated DNA repair dioxygenase AlkB